MLAALLEGGPYDGAGDDLMDEVAPAEVCAFVCRMCRKVHVAPVRKDFRIQDSHLYRFNRMNRAGAYIYVYAEIDPVQWHIQDRELTPIAV